MFAYCVVDGGIELTNNYDPFDADFFNEVELETIASAVSAGMMIFDTGAAVYAINPMTKNAEPKLLISYRDRVDEVQNGD